MNTADRLDEFVSLRLPAGAGRLLTDDARRMGLSRSELLRRAALDYIRRANAKSVQDARQ
jgi:hypothetical protein